MGGKFSTIQTLGGPTYRPVVDFTKHPITVDQFLFQLHDGPLMAGDLVFTSGTSLASQITMWGSWSRFSHVMMVDKDPLNDQMPHFLYESVSTGDGLIDVHTQSIYKKGVRLILARDKLINAAHHDNKKRIIVGLVRLNVPSNISQPSINIRHKLYKRLSELQSKEYYKCYERERQNLAAIEASKVLGENVRDNSEYFCSELIAETYRMLHIIRHDTNTSMIGPKHLGEHLNGVNCINNFSLGPELYLYALDIPPAPISYHHN